MVDAVGHELVSPAPVRADDPHPRDGAEVRLPLQVRRLVDGSDERDETTRPDVRGRRWGRRGVPDGVGAVVASSAASDGVGGTTDVRRNSPEPAASAPPTSRTAATASSVKPRRAASGRSGAGVDTRDRGEALAQIGRGRLGLTDLGARTRRAVAVPALDRSSDGPLGVGGIDRVVQPLQGVVEARLDGPGRDVESLRDVVDGQVAVVPQRDDDLVVGRQRGDGGADDVAVLAWPA